METKNASLRLTDPTDIANATLALSIGTHQLPRSFSSAWFGEEGSWSFSALAAVVHACALCGYGGNEIVAELGRRLAAQCWELYSFGGAFGENNLIKTAAELWWLQGRVPGRLGKYLRESLRSMTQDANKVTNLLLRQPEIRDQPPTSEKGRIVESWSCQFIDGSQQSRTVTKLLIRSASETALPTNDITLLRDLMGVTPDQNVSSAVRKLAALLGVAWEAYPVPILYYARPGTTEQQVVNFIIVRRNGWIPSDLILTSWHNKATTVALYAEDSYKFQSFFDEGLLTA